MDWSLGLRVDLGWTNSDHSMKGAMPSIIDQEMIIYVPSYSFLVG
jgi:hypothetical protein